MRLSDYKNLIQALPVRQHSFKIYRNKWIAFEQQFEWLMNLNTEIFGITDEIRISRQDVFNSVGNIRELIIKAIYWGYITPNRLRGNNFTNIVNNIGLISNNLNAIIQQDNPSQDSLLQLIKNFKEIPGIGISTYSKLLYFCNLRFNGFPCIILDNRIINILNTVGIRELIPLNNITYNTAPQRYFNYIEVINNCAIELETDPENVEQFLFMFGNNLND